MWQKYGWCCLKNIINWSPTRAMHRKTINNLPNMKKKNLISWYKLYTKLIKSVTYKVIKSITYNEIS